MPTHVYTEHLVSWHNKGHLGAQVKFYHALLKTWWLQQNSLIATKKGLPDKFYVEYGMYKNYNEIN